MTHKHNHSTSAAIAKITNRAAEIGESVNVEIDKAYVATILSDVHENACPLRVQEMAEGPINHLAHDVFGILRHYDERRHRFRDCFWPRYAAALLIGIVLAIGAMHPADATPRCHVHRGHAYHCHH